MSISNLQLPGLPSNEAVKAEVTNALANVSENVASLPGKDRPAIYDEAIRNAVPKLKTGYNISWPLTCTCITQKLCFCGPTGNVDGVLYLPYDMSNRRMHCAQAIDYGGYWGSIPEMVNYFVKYTHTAVHAKTMKQKMKPKFAALEASKDSIVKAVFAGNHDNLCERVVVALRDKAVSGSIEGTGFSAFVAVRCAYDFVWYELGWRYYTAARTTSEYVLEANDGTFNANCGQLIFLP
ncbi:hypothetical protein AAVH_34148 [Aphelenchoides avenae]|nr:hypothetical protein AAVH_34148 [Aphelenchus avenae]